MRSAPAALIVSTKVLGIDPANIDWTHPLWPIANKRYFLRSLDVLAHMVQAHSRYTQCLYEQFKGKTCSGFRAQIQQRGRVRQLTADQKFFFE